MNKMTVVGIDFGGTKIKFGLVDQKGRILGEPMTMPTESNRDAHAIVKTMIEGIERTVQNAGLSLNQIEGIGIGSPGPLDLKKGTILEAPNLPTQHFFPLKQHLEERFRKPVEINNDGNCFVLGEACFGAAQNAVIVCGLTLGTGCGCGIVMNRKIYAGSTGTAAEIWCAPYLDSNVEEYGSAKSIRRIYKRIAGKDSEAKAIFDLALKGDKIAVRAWSEFGFHVGKIVAVMVNLLDPDVVVIGGSVSNAWEFFHETLIETVNRNITKAPREHLKIERSSLGENAGLLGAAALLLP
ncbi:MAG TPA: ROK family protein [bacterium]